MNASFLFNDRPEAAAAWEDDSDTAWAEFQRLAGEPGPGREAPVSGLAPLEA